MNRLTPVIPGGRKVLVIVMVAMLALCVLVPLPGSPQSSGIVGRTRTGCTCHNQTESLAVAPAVVGLPGSWEPGEEYVLEISYEGGPVRGPGARAGFDLRASKGELVVEGGSIYERVDPGTGEATHTLEGANESAWRVVWRSPDEGEGDVTFVLVVNAVNGDGVQGPGDQWGRTQVVVPEGDPGGLGRASDFWIVVALAAMLAIAALAWHASRGPRVERR